MLEGLPDLFEWTVGMVTNRRQHDSLQVVVFHLLGDLQNAAAVGLSQLFSHVKNMSRPTLQPFGSPISWQNSAKTDDHERWVRHSNEDFERVDACVHRLMLALGLWCSQTADWRDENDFFSNWDAYFWLHAVKAEYVSCVVGTPWGSLTYASLDVAGFVDSVSWRFLPIWSPNRRQDEVERPAVVTKVVHELSDTAANFELQRLGFERLEKMRVCHDAFAAWLRANCTMEEVTAPHSKTLSDGVLWRLF